MRTRGRPGRASGSRSLAGKDLPRRTGSLERPAFWDLPPPDGRAGRAIGMQFAPRRDTEVDGEGTERTYGPAGSSVTFVLARERAGLDRTLAAFRTTLIVVGVVFVAASALLVTVVAKKGLAPLARVAEASRRPLRAMRSLVKARARVRSEAEIQTETLPYRLLLYIVACHSIACVVILRSSRHLTGE